MSAILQENLLTLHAAAQLLPSNRAGKRVNFATVWRWVLKGVRGFDGSRVHLEAVRVGGRWLTSQEALERFATTLTPQIGADIAIPTRTPARRRRESASAAKKLEAMGIK